MFYTIDGLRGVAALLVVCRHIVPLHAGTLNFQSSYLAVELFFLFSGFVIAHAYDGRFEDGMPFWEFVKVRLLRLYPLYFLGFAIAVLTIPMARLAGLKTWPLDWRVLLPNLFILPSLIGFAGGVVFPFNNPSWTLFFELVGNYVYRLIFKPLNNRRLAIVCLVSALCLAWTAFTFHSLDVGYNQKHFIGGFGRVFFSFFMGVAVYRLQNLHPCKLRISPWILMAAMTLLLTMTVQRGLPREFYDTACALIIFPVFAYLATAVEPGPKVQKVFMLGGGASYALYLIHAPLGGMLNVLFLIYGRPKGSLWLGLGFIAAVSLLSVLAERYYDRPVRRWLTGMLGKPRQDADRNPVSASAPSP
jgi:peptidoglycan/LPS O-acetylase OafA/YrhL